GIHLPGEAKCSGIEGVPFHAGATIREKRPRRSKIGSLFATRHKEPQLVLLHGPANGAVEVLDFIDRKLAGETAGSQLLIDVGADKFGVYPAEEQVAVKLVAAILGHHVSVDAPSRNFRCDVAGLISRLLKNRIFDIVL